MKVKRVVVITSVMASCLVWVSVIAAEKEPGSSAERIAGVTHHDHGGHAGHGSGALRLQPAEGAKVVLWQPNLEQKPLEVEKGGVGFPRTGLGGYHAIVAEWAGAAGQEALIGYKELRGRPTEHSPRELLAADKTDLEIVPDPLPREHYRYHTREAWGFLLRFQGKPLADARVMLHTQHGSHLEADSDAEGYLVFELPDDFPEVRPGRDSNPPGEFRLSVAHESGGRRYHSALVSLYHPNPGHWRSFGGGVGILLLGAVAGFTAARRRDGGSGK